MAIWCEPIKQQIQELFKEISELIEKYIFIDVKVNKILEGYSPNIISKMILGAVFGIAMQYMIEPENEDLLDGLNMIQTVIE
jgi:Holliday junction resolvasome RuvABC endonuclease subunit